MGGGGAAETNPRGGQGMLEYDPRVFTAVAIKIPYELMILALAAHIAYLRTYQVHVYVRRSNRPQE